MMVKLSLLFLVVCMASLLDHSVGLNYYLQTNPGNPGLVTYTLIPAFRRPDCDKKKEKDKGSSSEGSSSSESSSSEESSEEVKVSGESKDKKENKEGKSKEGATSGSEEKDRESQEDSSEEKKKEDKKKDDSNSLFPPRTYNFPPSSKIRKVVYSPLSTYAYSPFRSTYLAQPPISSYSLTKNGYQYVSVPDTANGVKDYTSSVARRLVNSPITKIVYSPSGLSYPTVSKTAALSPGARVYSAQDYWNNPFNYFKK